MNFYSSKEDPLNGGDSIHHSFISTALLAIRRHKHIEWFFSSIDTTINTPSWYFHPNLTVNLFLNHVMHVLQEAIFIGINISCDDQTVGFQFNHKYKQIITCKKEGGSFLVYYVCSNGYTYAFHFCHQKSIARISKSLKLSPLHARIIG